MKGVVSNIRKNGFYEVKADSLVSIVELVGCSILNVGDEVEGDFDSPGGKEIYNLSQGKEAVDVFIQEVIK